MYGFHLYIVVVIKMVEPQDDYDQNEAMMNIINAGTQYGPNNQNEVDLKFDNGSQYLLNFEDEQEPLVQENLVQENAGEVYLLIILHLLYI
jgi:hypothetical protein